MKAERKYRRKSRNIAIICIAAALLVAAAVAAIVIFKPFERLQLPSVQQAVVSEPIEEVPAESAETPTAAPTALQQAEAEEGLARPEGVGESDALQRSLYEAVLEIDTDDMTLHGRLRLSYLCTSVQPLYSVKLHLYPNAVVPGCMVLNTVTLDGVDAYYELENEDTVLTLQLAMELYTGDSVIIYLDYTIQIPETGNRFGYGRDTVMLGNALPIAAVFEDGNWRTDRYLEIGDSFYSEVADYKVAISAPENWLLAATGDVLEEELSEDGVRVTYVTAPQVRDFCCALHKNAKVATSDAAGVEVYCLARHANEAEFGARVAAEALIFNNEMVGRYPYKRLCVVQMDAGGGMEYPGLVMISEEYFTGALQGVGEYVIVHEVAHQWWYGVVGSDEIMEPWVDESLTEFMSLEYFRVMKSTERYEQEKANEFSMLEGYVRKMRMDATLAEFAAAATETETPYDYTVYFYGAYVYQQLFDYIGEAAFYDALQTYYNTHRLQNATGEDLIAAFSEAAGKNLSRWFEGRFKVSDVPVFPAKESEAS